MLCFLVPGLYFDRFAMLAVLFVSPHTNVRLAHLSRPNSIRMSSEYCFTSSSSSANFLSFGAKSFRSSMI